MKAEFTARLGREVVAYIRPMPIGYVMTLNDGRKIPAFSLQEYRDAGYVVESNR